MHEGIKNRKRTKTGKRFFISISCLVLLSLNVFTLTCAAGLGIEGTGRDIKEEKDYQTACREAGGFNNPIDDCYLSVLYYGGGPNANDTLRGYEAAWREQLSGYVEHEMKNGNMVDKRAAGEYMKAILNAVYAQKNLMEYMGVEQEKILWYSAQIYRHAFIRDIKGEFAENDFAVVALNEKEGNVREMPAKAYEVYGEFSNEMRQGGQESFDINWSNELCRLTMEFYEELDEEGKRLTGIWQESRENWKRASNEYFLSLNKEINAEKTDIYAGEKEVFAEMVERDGWINRLYFLQLQSIK